MNAEEMSKMTSEEFIEKVKANATPRQDLPFGEDPETLEEQLEAFSKFSQTKEDIEAIIKASEYI